MIAPGYMDNERIGHLIKQFASEVLEDEPGAWKFSYEQKFVFVFTDASHNRMRIMTPVIDISEIHSEQWLLLMSANFDRALDARYCVNGDILWSAFIHPLQELSVDQFVDALKQVVTLSSNFGSSYASSRLMFGGS